MAQLDTSAAAVALRQLIILERGFPLATRIIVVGEKLDAQNAPGLLDEIIRLEASWKTTINAQPRNDVSHTHLIAAFERLNVPFLSGWEAAEVQIRDDLAAGVFDDLATWRDEASGWSSDLWLVMMLGDDQGAARAKAIVAVDEDADEWDRWLVDGKLDKKSTRELRDRFVKAKGPLETKPVKTHEKIDRQIGAYLAKQLERAILDKSFKQWFAYCYHPGSPSNFSEKKKHILAHNLFVDPKPPAETLAFVRSCLADFTPARARARRVRLGDIEPIRDQLLEWKRACSAIGPVAPAPSRKPRVART